MLIMSTVSESATHPLAILFPCFLVGWSILICCYFTLTYPGSLTVLSNKSHYLNMFSFICLMLVYYCCHEYFQSDQLVCVYRHSIVLIANFSIDLPSLSSEPLSYFLNWNLCFISLCDGFHACNHVSVLSHHCIM